MPEPRSDLIPRTDQLPGQSDDSSPLPPILNGTPTDNTPTVISKSLIRPATAEDALNGLRGRRLAHFELLEAIGVGGMAAVLRARDTQLDRIVALKILPPEMAIDPENVRRFHQEARSAAKLDHENIARVFFCGEDQRLHFIAFEFVEGDNLRTILERRGRLPVGEALHYILQIAAGLHHAAARGVVHRDIKPSNIIVTPHSRAKLVDMGLARCLESRHDKGLTHSGVTLGTFDYISPEQALEPRDADVRSDIYSLGCTFYHMITGHPPVPEGTAARKLHHHQQIKPTDPRELAPNIPDEVAMILARMMAKNPHDRYQTPEHLVHDLLVAMRKLGTGGNVPEGVLAVEASLPQTASYRPMLFVALAAAVVVALILLVAPSVTPPPLGPKLDHPTGKNDHPNNPPKDLDRAIPKDSAKELKDPPPLTSAVAKYEEDAVTPADLARWLKEHEDAEEIDIALARDLDLTDRGLLVKAKKVNLHPKDPNRRPTIRFTSSSAKPSSAALTIESKEAIVEGVRVVLDGSSAEGAMMGLLLHGGGQYRVKHCEFTQARRGEFDESPRLASVVFDNRSSKPDSQPALLELTECAFLGFGQLDTLEQDARQFRTFALSLRSPQMGGQDAIVRRGPGLLKINQCVIGPHTAAFRLEGGSEQDLASVKHCSVLTGRGSTVFDFHDDATALDVRYSLFSRPGAVPELADKEGAVLIRQSGARTTVKYHGEDNRYYNLSNYWIGDGHEETNYEAFRGKLKLADPSGSDERSRELSASPWQDESPLEKLKDTLYFVQFRAEHVLPDDATLKRPEVQLAEAFQVKLKEPGLRTGEAGKILIGVEHLGKSIAYANQMPPLEDKKPEPPTHRTLVVDPNATSNDLTYKTLQAAVFEATKPGDVIVIKHTGPLNVEPIALAKPNIDLTIRPERGYRPVLVMSETTDRDAFLFRLHDGKLRLEDLEFRLRSSQPQLRSLTLATLIGDGQCSFKDCVITLDPAGQETPLAVVTLADSGDVMKMTPPGMSSPPRLAFDNCFVRGKGDLIWSRVSRPFDLDLKNSLLVLQGSVLNVEVAENAAARTTELEAKVKAEMIHTTTYLSGYFLRVKGKELKGLIPLGCNATASLFVAATSGQTFIHLEGPDRLKEKLTWSGEKNVYSGYMEMLSQQPMGEEMRPASIEKGQPWRIFAPAETASTFPSGVKFTKLPSEMTAFTRLTPEMFTRPTDLIAGADVQQIPKPGSDEEQ